MRSFIPYLPQALYRLRLDSDLTQRQAAAQAGITPNMLSNYERGRRLPSVLSMEQFRLLANLF